MKISCASSSFARLIFAALFHLILIAPDSARAQSDDYAIPYLPNPTPRNQVNNPTSPSWNPKALQNPTPDWVAPQMQPQVIINVKDNTKEFRFVQKTNDPYVYTKAYICKNADPYEMRYALIDAVMAKRLQNNDCTVECIKYNDGTGLLLVSAEDYRFKKQKDGGMTIDEMVEALDIANLKGVSGSLRFAYFPKYVTAAHLQTMLIRVGINARQREMQIPAMGVTPPWRLSAEELEYGRSFTSVDDELNALYFYVPNYDLKNALDRLKFYDRPIPEVKFKVTVYEIYDENDGKLGADFQSWKNGPGADFFTVGGRWRNNWDPAFNSPGPGGSSQTKFLNFNPKWNSRYLDMIGAEGHSRVLTRSEIVSQNRVPATIQVASQIPVLDLSQSVGNEALQISYQELNGTFVPAGTAASTAANLNTYLIQAYDAQGTQISISERYTGTMLLGRYQQPSINGTAYTFYSLKIPNGETFFVKNGKVIGTTEKQAMDLQLRIPSAVAGTAVWVPFAPVWNNSISGQQFAAGALVQTDFVSGNATGQNYGYNLTLTPVICENTSSVSISINNTSLAGFNSDGSVRLSNSAYSTEVLLDNGKAKMLIGGIEKKIVLRGVTKVPWLGDLPLLGWLFSSEYEDSKKSEIVTVLECSVSNPAQPLPEEWVNTIRETDSKLDKAGMNDQEDFPYGFNQFILDKSKKKLEKAP